MADDGTPARVTAFSQEQGFGRVVVEGEGELPFDASVAQCPPKELTIGAEVRVEIGPSRVPGKRKVVRLWTSTSAVVADPAVSPTGNVERMETLGPYQLLLPSFWPQEPAQANPPVWTTVARLNDVACMLMIYAGAASDTKAKTNLVAQRGQGATVTRCDRTGMGLPFEGHRIERPTDVERMYILEAHGDILIAGCRCAPANERDAEGLEPLLLSILGAAVIRRGPPADEAPKPAATGGGGFWKRLFTN